MVSVVAACYYQTLKIYDFQSASYTEHEQFHMSIDIYDMSRELTFQGVGIWERSVLTLKWIKVTGIWLSYGVWCMNGPGSCSHLKYGSEWIWCYNKKPKFCLAMPVEKGMDSEGRQDKPNSCMR